MTKSINTADGGGSLPSELHHRHFHQNAASEKELSAAHIKAAAHLKDTTKLGNILKKIGGGLSRHRP